MRFPAVFVVAFYIGTFLPIPAGAQGSNRGPCQSAVSDALYCIAGRLLVPDPHFDYRPVDLLLTRSAVLDDTFMYTHTSSTGDYDLDRKSVV
jgi:hypothetical protein